MRGIRAAKGKERKTKDNGLTVTDDDDDDE